MVKPHDFIIPDPYFDCCQLYSWLTHANLLGCVSVYIVIGYFLVDPYHESILWFIIIRWRNRLFFEASKTMKKTLFIILHYWSLALVRKILQVFQTLQAFKSDFGVRCNMMFYKFPIMNHYHGFKIYVHMCVYTYIFNSYNMGCLI